MVSSLSGASLTSTAGIEQLVTLSTARERQTVTDLKTQIENLEVKRGIYTDVQSKLQAIESALTDLRGTDGEGGALNVFKPKISGEEGAFTASVTDGDKFTSAVTYAIKVNQLATRQRLATEAADASALFADGLDTEIVAEGATATFSIQLGSGDAVEITLDATEGALTLSDLVSAINESDAEVRASVINDGNGARLVLESLESGAENTIATTASGFASGALDTGLSLDGSAANIKGEIVQEAKDAEVVINGITINSSSNTIDGAIAGLSLTLTAESEEANGSTLTIAKDTSDIKKKITALLDAVNGAVKHLRLKTEPQLDAEATGDNPTYKSAPLGGDYSMRELRYGLTSDLLSFFSGAASGGYDSLMDLGIDVGDDNVTLKLDDADALTDALENNFSDVLALFEHVGDKLSSRLDRYIDDSSSIISRTQDSIDDQIESMGDRKDSASERLTRMEAMYRDQFYKMQAQLLTMQYDYQNTMSLMYSSQSLLSGNTSG